MAGCAQIYLCTVQSALCLLQDSRKLERQDPWGQGTKAWISSSTLTDTVNHYRTPLHIARKGLRRRQWKPTPVLLLGKSPGWRSLVGCSPWGRQELDMTEQLHFHFSLSCIGEGNGNSLQCSCLENPRDKGSLVGCCLWSHIESDTIEVTLAASAAAKRALVPIPQSQSVMTNQSE